MENDEHFTIFIYEYCSFKRFKRDKLQNVKEIIIKALEKWLAMEDKFCKKVEINFDWYIENGVIKCTFSMTIFS